MSFRIKLLLSMMLVVGAITGATLLATQRKVQTAYEQIFEDQFQSQIDYFSQMQELRLANVRERSLNFAKSVRVQAAMNDYLSARSKLQSEDTPQNRDDMKDAVKLLTDNLNEVIFARFDSRPQAPPSFAGIVDDGGAVIREGQPTPSPTRRGPDRGRRDLDFQLSSLSNAMKGEEQQQTGYLAPATESTNSQLHEVILTKIIDTPTEQVLGALVLGFRVSDFAERSLSEMSQIQSGVYLDDEIHSRRIPENIRPMIADRIKQTLSGSKTNQSRFALTIDNRPHTVFFRSLNLASDFPPAYQVCVYSLEEPARVQRELRSQILLFGALAMAGALAFSLILSHGLSAPINQLVAGTQEVAKGNLEVRVPIRSRDEIGKLAQSFNEMTEGLALKEKYRSVLNLVADKRIAEDLMQGKITLGGEDRQVSVLFCDIRGFTALTQNMPPQEVVLMLNEHFTPLTRVVYENHGVVDKFVGDLIMAVFGAPTSHGDDPVLAVKCALQMIEERTKQNDTSKYKISVGIGVATGKVLAGRMGSVDRLNYTVLGPRVNLAARLCSQAGRMEVVIDETTYAACKDIASVEPLPELRLKGFSEPVQAYKIAALRTP